MTPPVLGPYNGDTGALVAACICLGVTNDHIQVIRAQELIDMLKKRIGSRVDEILDQAVAFAARGDFGSHLGEPKPKQEGEQQYVQTIFTPNELAVVYIMTLIGGCTLVAMTTGDPIVSMMLSLKTQKLKMRYDQHSQADADSALRKLLATQS